MKARASHSRARVSPWLATLVTVSLAASGCERLVFYFGALPADGPSGSPLDLSIVPSSCEQPPFDLAGLGCGNGPVPTAIRFLEEKSITVVGFPWAATAADLNGDGRKEVVVATTAGYHVIGNPGDGTLYPGTLHPLPIIAHQVVAGDFDGDGDLDLAFAGDKKIAFERNDGLCGFTAVPVVGSVIEVSAMSSGFLDGDRSADLFFGSLNPGPGGVTQGIIYGGPDLHTRPAITFGFGGSKTSVAVLDLDGDGLDDMVLADPGTLAAGPYDASIASGSMLEIYFADPVLGVRRDPLDPQIVPVHNRSVGVIAADLDGDTVRDLAVRYSDPPAAGPLPNGVAFLHNSHTLHEAPAERGSWGLTDAEPVAAAVADFDHDMRTDVVVATGGAAPLLIPVRSAGAPTGASVGAGRAVGAGVTDVIAVDINCDPYPDLVVVHAGVSVDVVLNSGAK